MPDPRPLCWAPYHLDSGFPQWCALVIAHACFKKAIAFSGTGHGSSRDGAMRNSSNSQQSSDTTMVISLNSMFTSGMAFQAKNLSQYLVCMEKTTGRCPHLILMLNYPAHQLSCLPVHRDRRGVHAFPCNSSAWAWGHGERWLTGRELGLGFSGG